MYWGNLPGPAFSSAYSIGLLWVSVSHVFSVVKVHILPGESYIIIFAHCSYLSVCRDGNLDALKGDVGAGAHCNDLYMVTEVIFGLA